MSKISTKQTIVLVEALKKRGVHVTTEHWDGHKHVDIFIPAVGMYIEIDGLPHYTSPKQIISDFQRDHFSDTEGFVTKHIPNKLIETHLEEMADAIAEIVLKKAIVTPLNQGTSI